MIRLLAITALYGLSVLFSTHAASESLMEVYTQAIENDHEFKAAIAEQKNGRQIVKEGLAKLLPSIDAGASYQDRTRTIRGVDTSSNQTFDDKRRTESWSQDNFVRLSQPLFNMQAWYGYKRVKLIEKRSDAQFRQEEQALITRTANAYFDTLKAIDTLTTSRAEERALAHQLEQTKQRFEVGLTAITEVHEARAAYDSATASRLISEGNVGIAFEALSVLTGKQYQSLAPLREDFAVTGPQPSARSEWEQMAVENNPQLVVAKFDEDSSRYDVKIRKSERLPTVSTGLRYSTSKSGGTQLPNQNISDGYAISVDMSVPIYMGGERSARINQAKNNYESAVELRKKTRRDVLQQTRSQHLNILTSVATVKARKQEIISFTSALEATQAGYEVGTRDLVDVLNAQRNLFNAEKNYAETLYSYILDSLELKQTAGILSTTDVENLEQWLDKSRSVNGLQDP